jgi:hypothetical protein
MSTSNGSSLMNGTSMKALPVRGIQGLAHSTTPTAISAKGHELEMIETATSRHGINRVQITAVVREAVTT